MVETALQELIAAVIDSPEYREFDRQKKIMKQHPDLKAEDRPSFRQENFELQQSVQSDELFDRTDELSRRLGGIPQKPAGGRVPERGAGILQDDSGD
ncbi:MAG: hypothetical protein ACLTQL_01825 [Eisenbergiella sp.]